MNKYLRILLMLSLAIAAWLGLQACSSMQGELAPTLVGGEIVMQEQFALPTPVSNHGWRLLNFFGPG